MPKELNSYNTVIQFNEDETIINKSRFISRVYFISSEEEANGIINKVKKEHYKATHVCSAWRLAVEPIQEKANDDGEPSGTAGKPILEILRRKDLKNILVLVIRYFGGIKLGAGGLIRAYSSSARDVIDKSSTVKINLENVIEVETEYNFYQGLKLELERYNIKPVNEEFLDTVKLTFHMPIEKTEKFIELIQDFTNDNYISQIVKQDFIERTLEEKEYLI